MLEQRIRVISEALARGLDRRTFLRRTGGTIVAGVTALAVGPLLSKSAPGVSAAPIVPDRANCAPPGPYCSLDGSDDPNGCAGAHCFQYMSSGELLSCVVDYRFYPGTGCWTTIDGTGYWTCCDCSCTNTSGSINNVSCGCAQYTRAAQPIPGVALP
jgi:hypothetical protein